MKWFRRNRSDQDARVAEARAAAGHAEREVELSRRRAESVRKHVVDPLREYAEHNQFADLIRQSLINGNDSGGKA